MSDMWYDEDARGDDEDTRLFVLSQIIKGIKLGGRLRGGWCHRHDSPWVICDCAAEDDEHVSYDEIMVPFVGWFER